MDFKLNADEIDCVKKLAERFEKNETWVNYGSANNLPDPLKPRDIVEHIKTTIRSNRIMAWAILGFFALTALITLLNQLAQLLKALGLLKDQPIHP